MGNVVCTPVGKAVVDAVEVTHNGVTISKSALVINDESKQSWVECTFTNIIDHAQLNKLVEEMNGWTVEAFYLNADKTSITGIVCATEGNGRDDNGNAYGRQGWGIADNKGYPYYIFGTRGKYWSTTSQTTTGTNNSDFVHVMGVYDAVAKTNTLYINGVAVKSAMADGFVASQAFGKDSTGEKVFNIGTGFFIGADPTVAALTSDYPARDLKVADVKIYAGALTESEALEAYKNATAEFTDNSVNKDAAENVFVSAGYNLDDYTRLEISPTLHAYYNSTSASKSNLVQNGTSNELLFWATQLFTKEEIPVGSVIVIADGYQYRPEGWQAPDMQNTNLRPGNTRSTITVVDDSWWSDFTVRGFNISSVSAQTITENDYGAFAVFVPKKDADTPEDIVVFLDPGHGGTDTGSTKEYDGVVYKESDINLAVALKTKAKLEALGYKVILSRTDDTYIQISDRPAAAIAANANMFVSIHVNSAIDDIAKGFEAYYSGKNVNYDAKAFAEFFTNEFAKIKDITSSDNLNVLAYPDMTIRGTKADTKLYTNGLAVLNQKESDMPSALLELGFMTNETDFLMLRSAYWQNFAAEAIANAVVAAHAAGIYKK
jgi:N-acetylmuramoyl-L-alanine amidase